MFFHDEMVTENYITNKTANLYKDSDVFPCKSNPQTLIWHQGICHIRCLTPWRQKFVTEDV